jgi:DNA polymerase bacteriophage-type
MKFNWHPTKPAFLDFETQSRVDLTSRRRYASDPTTHPLTCCIKTPDGKMHRFGPYLTSDDKAKMRAIADECTLVAHNAPFDAAIWEMSAGLGEAEWYDTLPVARSAGLPGKLDDIGIILTGEGKDKNGKRLVDMLCILGPKRAVPALGPAHDLLMNYNQRDVELLEQIYYRVHGAGMPDQMSVDYVINQRGVPINREYIHQLYDLYELNQENLRAEFDQSTGGTNPNSPKQVKEWLANLGFAVESIGKHAIKDLIATPEKFYTYGQDDNFDSAVESMIISLDQRREVTRVGKGKAEAIIEALDDDDRIRDQFVYHGAHPGRWAGRGAQFHNMPAVIARTIDSRSIPLNYEAIKLAAQEASVKNGYKILNADILSTMLRTSVQTDNMLIADYAAVEARGIAYIADEMKMLNLFSDPHKSVYIDMGTIVFGRPITKKGDADEYNMAKTLVLGCGYGMSGAKFEHTCKSRGVSVATFEKAGMKASDAVKVYRQAYPRIPAVWKEVGDAVLLAVGGVPMEAGKCKFYMQGLNMICELPSGRKMTYRNARIEQRVPGFVKMYNMPEMTVPTVVFDLPRLFGTKCKEGFLYGSKMCENIVQAMCRDFVAETLVNLESEGMRPFIHVHDEIGCEADESKLDRFMEIMSTPPTWAPNFPLLAEGYSGAIWSKLTKGYRTQDAINGRMLNA